jgi:hypothetical protein
LHDVILIEEAKRQARGALFSIAEEWNVESPRGLAQVPVENCKRQPAPLREFGR